MRKYLIPILSLAFLLMAYEQVFAVQFFNQKEFRFRNNDGNEMTATWMAAQNTNVTLTSSNQAFRIRILTEDVTASTLTPNLFYKLASGNTCSSGAAGTLVGTSSAQAFNLIQSANFVDKTGTTNQLTGGSNLFQNGETSWKSNPLDAIVFSTVGNYTEHEWMVRQTSKAFGGTAYIFCMFNNGAPISVYTVTPQLTTAATSTAAINTLF